MSSILVRTFHAVVRQDEADSVRHEAYTAHGSDHQTLKQANVTLPKNPIDAV